MHIIARNVNGAFNTLVDLFHKSQHVNENIRRSIPCRVRKENSRNGTVLVVDEPVIITYECPTERVLFNTARDANPFFHVYESLWMLAGRNDVEPLAYYNSRIANYSDDGKTFNGAYGYRWRHAGPLRWDLEGEGEEARPNMRAGVRPTSTDKEGEPRIDQLQILINHLRAMPESRRAVLSMWNVENDLLKIGGGICPTCKGEWTEAKAKELDENPAQPCPNCGGNPLNPYLHAKSPLELTCVRCNGTGKSSTTLYDQNNPSYRGEMVSECHACKGKGLLLNPGARDVCCNLDVMFALREEPHDGDAQENVTYTENRRTGAVTARHLDMTVTNRSNDMVWGALGANVVHFSFLQEYMAAHLGARVGHYHHISNNMHVYCERDDWKPELLLAADNPKQRTMWSPRTLEYGELARVPLVSNPTRFDEELPLFVERHKQYSMGGNYSEQFLMRVAQPLCLAWHRYKLKEWDGVFAALRECEDEAWRSVAETWMDKRRRNAQARQETTHG